VKNRWCLCDADGIENGRWAGSASSWGGRAAGQAEVDAGGLGRGGGFMLMALGARWRRWGCSTVEMFWRELGTRERSKMWAGRMRACCWVWEQPTTAPGQALRPESRALALASASQPASQAQVHHSCRFSIEFSPTRKRHSEASWQGQGQHTRSGPLGQWAVSTQQ
jgi:hypothetical protein